LLNNSDKKTYCRKVCRCVWRYKSVV